MALNEESLDTALEMVKIRLNRADDALDEYLENRLTAEAEMLAGNGIALTDTMQDIMLLVDLTAWRHNNRDKAGTMPEWLRLARRERWLKEGHGDTG